MLTFTALSMSVSAAVILGESAWAGGRQEMSPRVQEVRKESEVESEVEFMRRQKVGRKSGEGARGDGKARREGKTMTLLSLKAMSRLDSSRRAILIRQVCTVCSARDELARK